MAMVKGRTIRFGITSLLHFQIKYQCHTTRTIIPLTRDGLASELFMVCDDKRDGGLSWWLVVIRYLIAVIFAD